jgi:hypothetical protein
MFDHALSTQQIAVISALSTGATMTYAAEQAGVHRNTILNWRRNLIPFQHALADAQYDRALVFREAVEAHLDLAVQTIHNLLSDPNTPASVRLKAALAVISLASTPPAPKRQTVLEIEKLHLADPPASPAPKNAQPCTTQNPVGPSPSAAPRENSAEIPPAVHNPAQSPRTVPPKPGRNESCPCGSGLKYKRCCLDKPNSLGLAA